MYIIVQLFYIGVIQTPILRSDSQSSRLSSVHISCCDREVVACKVAVIGFNPCVKVESYFDLRQ